MLLQIAIDEPSDLRLVGGLAGIADVIEVGTRVIKWLGVGTAVAEVRAAAPDTLILADMKTADGGRKETELVAAAGAQFTTVLAAAADATLEAVARTASESGLRVLIDTLGDSTAWHRPAVRALAGSALLALHTPMDTRPGTAPHSDSAAARLAGFRIALAGGIGPSRIAEVSASGAELVVVGGAVTRSPDPIAAATNLRAQLPEPGTGWLGR